MAKWAIETASGRQFVYEAETRQHALRAHCKNPFAQGADNEGNSEQTVSACGLTKEN